MESTLNNNIPQAGKPPCEVNPTIGSDRVKASVAGAGAQDSGGVKMYEIQMLGEGTPDQKPHESSCTDKLLQLEEAIEKLLKMLEDKQQQTVNNNTRGLVRKVKIVLKSFKSAMSKEQAAKVSVLTNPRVRELLGVRKELHFAPVGKPLLNLIEGTPQRKA
ncbi:hypothetical protein KM043_017584 [Ampulex compressa]|nr:hypothetical protein KM043_017584 [Ampulex compressa]